MTADLDKLFEAKVDLPPPEAPLEKSALPSGGGVYAFTDENDRVIQTIGTQSLRRSIVFRLNPPDDEKRRRRTDVRAIARRIRWTPTHSTFETSLVYLRVARVLMPKEYRKQLAFGPVWFAGIDPGARFPRWAPDTIVRGSGGVDVGPFTDRDRCTIFVKLLEDLFDLCRKYDVLVQAPNGQACVYFEMGKCPAPCDGSVSLDEYRAMIRRSEAFARGEHDRMLNELQQCMERASTELAFERAGHIKTSIDRARKVLASDGRLVPVPEQFRYLVVQRAGGRSRVKPYFVNRGHIIEGEAVRLKQIPEVVSAWTDKTTSTYADKPLDPVCASETMWLVSHFVLKKDKAPGLFLHASELHDADTTGQRIAARFVRRPQTSENDPSDTSCQTDVDSPLK